MFPGRTPLSWTLRGTLAAAILVSGYYAAGFSLAQWQARSDPAFAHRLAPGDGRITAALAVSLAQPNAAATDLSRADVLARRALHQDSTAVFAAATLGVLADMRGDAAGARSAFTYANRLSRRELRTRLWMIEEAVRRGDVAAALRQYDTTLRVLPNLADLLYPVLAAAGSDPQVGPTLVATLTRRPPWTESFVEYLATKGPDRRTTAVLLSRIAAAGVPVSQTGSAYAIDALIGERRVPEAWAYYATVRPGADRRRSRDPAFAAALDAPSQFDWGAVNDGSVSTALQRGVFDFSAPGSVGGPLLRQAQWLPAGRYRLTGRNSAVAGDARTLPYWSLTCPGGRELGRVSLTAQGDFAGRIEVPADCPVQMLTLVAQATDAVGGTSGQVQRAQLEPDG